MPRLLPVPGSGHVLCPWMVDTERPEARADSAHQLRAAPMVIQVSFFSKKEKKRDVYLLSNLGLTRCNVHMDGNQSSRVQAVRYQRQKGARVKAPRAAPSSVQIVPLSLGLSCSCSPTSKNQPQFFVRFNLHLLRTSLAARCRCPLLAQQTHRRPPPLSRPDRRASPRRLHPLFVLPSVRRGCVWCGFVAPDVVALRASNCITAPSCVRQVLLPSCTVISSRAVFSLVSTLNIDRVLAGHPFSHTPPPTRALPRWQRLSLPAPRCRSGRSPSERLADHRPHHGPNPSPDPNPPPRPSPRVPTAGAASARHHPLVTRTPPRPRHPHPPSAMAAATTIVSPSRRRRTPGASPGTTDTAPPSRRTMGPTHS